MQKQKLCIGERRIKSLVSENGVIQNHKLVSSIKGTNLLIILPIVICERDTRTIGQKKMDRLH